MQHIREVDKLGKYYSVSSLIPMSLAKTGISITIIAFSSFLNAELTFRGWTPDYISLIIGSTAIFELVRFIFARLSDKNNSSKRYYSFGFAIATIGIALIPQFLDPENNYKMMLPMTMFYMGSAIMSTLIDSHLTAISTDDSRSNIATAIQITRLTGFAIGGIIGARLFSMRSTDSAINFAGDFFTSFTMIILITFILTGLSTLLSINENDRVINTTSEFNYKTIVEDISTTPSKLLLVFLFLYPIGLFMQDQILEPFAIIRLGFQEDGVGKLVTIWAALTLIFAPLGNIIAKKLSKISVLVTGQSLSASGLILIALSGWYLNTSILYFGVVVFGIGSGLFAVIGVTYMLDIVALHKRNLALLLSIFGMMLTISRSISALLASTILHYSDQNFELVFVIEAIFSLLSVLPIIKLEKILTFN